MQDTAPFREGSLAVETPFQEQQNKIGRTREIESRNVRIIKIEMNYNIDNKNVNENKITNRNLWYAL